MDEKGNMLQEPDMEKVFDLLKEHMPVPEEMKEAVLNAFVYVLSM